jgi:hypothetical protein
MNASEFCDTGRVDWTGLGDKEFFAEPAAEVKRRGSLHGPPFGMCGATRLPVFKFVRSFKAGGGPAEFEVGGVISWE